MIAQPYRDHRNPENKGGINAEQMDPISRDPQYLFADETETSLLGNAWLPNSFFLPPANLDAQESFGFSYPNPQPERMQIDTELANLRCTYAAEGTQDQPQNCIPADGEEYQISLGGGEETFNIQWRGCPGCGMGKQVGF